MKKVYIMFFVLVFFVTVLGVTVNAENSKTENSYKEVLKESNQEDIKYFKRSEFLSIIMKNLGYTKDLYVCSFNDIYETNWAYTYIANAEHRSIATGHSDGKFKFEEDITKQEAIAFLSRAYKINASMYENTIDLPFFVSDYARGYISYALINGTYPLESEMNNPDSKLTKEEGLKLLSSYENLDEEKLSEIQFSYSYPKLVESGKSNYVSILVKTNKPCSIYYMMSEANEGQSILIPDKQNINNYLGNTSKAEHEVKLSLAAKPNKRYNIFLVAVDNDGVRSRVHTIKNAFPLPFTQGSGTKNNPYKIYTSYQLEQIRYYPNSCFLLCNDISYNNIWEPVGDFSEVDTQFSGTFDGNGHRISGLIIEGKDGVGLFSSIYGGIVKNLSVDAQVEGENFVGVIAGVIEGGIIENCQVSGRVYARENSAGGIVGRNNGRVKNSASFVYTVNSTAYCGGIAGTNYSEIDSCISGVASVYSDMYASSIAGANISGIIKNCVGASVEVTDSLTENSGRITTNRENGITKNNYAYENMVSGLNTYIGIDSQDGEELKWKDITDKDFYKNVLLWDFDSIWKLDKKSDYLIPTIKNAKYPLLEAGVTVYHPKAVTNEDELKNISKELNYHYILKNDIVLKNPTENMSNWTPIGIVENEDFVNNAFCGSLDGNGYSVKNMVIMCDKNISQYGMFGVLYGANIRNLTIENAKVYGDKVVGILAGKNYATIENCYIDGEIFISSNSEGISAGGVVGENYGNIYNSNMTGEIKIDSQSSTIGGITALNEGFIDGCSFDGKISSISDKNESNSIIGKIVGSNYSGMIYNSSATGDMNSVTYKNYCGGILGMMNGGEIYKCSSYGRITVNSKNDEDSFSYVGGICALDMNGVIMNSFSQDNIYSASDNSYVGGILGYAENAYLQNTYSANTINQRGKIYDKNEENVYAGGILAYSTDSNMSGNVAINPYILTNGKKSSISAFFENGYEDNNYTYDKIYSVEDKDERSVLGIPCNIDMLRDYEFYVKPVEMGGKLGWMSYEYSGEDVWIKGSNKNYYFPTLMNVDNQLKFKETGEYR